MAHNIDHLHRRSIRLVGYDYSQAGAYFVTVCTHDRTCLFGDVVNGLMVLNDAGMIVADEWIHTQILRPYVQMDEFVGMPNHFHDIIVITRDMKPVHMDTSCTQNDDDRNGRGIACGAQSTDRAHPPGCAQTPDRKPVADDNTAHPEGTAHHTPTMPMKFGYAVPCALPTVIGSFKSAVTKRINENRDAAGEPVWQRNYYEHIIRSEKSLNHIRLYIADNPKQWAVDRDNVNAVTPEPRNIWRN